MPWTKDNPPSCAKNWTDSEKEKCVTAANAALKEGSEQDAIFACIRAAGKSKEKSMSENTIVRVKAVEQDDEWVLNILAVPYGSPNDRDREGEYFDAQTQTHADKFPTPPLVYHHGMTGGKQGLEEKVEYLGKTVKRWVDNAGEWVRGILDKTAPRAKQVWEAAKAGMAGVSPGAGHLGRVSPDGHIFDWPLLEVSLFDIDYEHNPVNRSAVAIPLLKSVYEQAGIDWPAEWNEPEGTAEDEPAQQVSSPVSGASANTKSGDNEMTMDNEAIQKFIAEQFAKQRELEDKQKTEEAEVARVKAMEAELEELKTKAAEDNRLKTDAPYIAKYGDTRKYDNLDVGEHSFLVGINEAGKMRPRWQPVSDACVKSLALKIESEGEKDEEVRPAMYALKAMNTKSGLKSDEIMYSTLTSYGDEWIGVAYSRDLWMKIREQTWVLDRMLREGYVREIPQGYESETIPLESTDPTWYKVAQANDTNATTGRPDATITSSQFSTGNKSISVAKMGCRVLFTGELTEDSLISIVPQARKQITASGANMFEHAIINGDTDTTTVTNINDIAGTPADTEVFTLVNGFRKLPLVTNTANYRAGGALTDTDFLETVKMLGTAGLNASDPTKVVLIPDANVYWKSLEMSTVKTRDVFAQATIEDGRLTRVYGFAVMPSWLMHYDESGSVTTLKVNSAGKLDIDTTTNDTYGALLAVRFDQWAFAWKRRLTLEVERWADADTNQIVAMARWGLAYRDTEASAITYGITGV